MVARYEGKRDFVSLGPLVMPISTNGAPQKIMCGI